MSISLFDSIFPQTEKNKTINQIISRQSENAQRTQSTKFGQLILTVAQQTAQAIIESQYRQFDALIKNFGCQITALEVQALLKTPFILKEAAKIKEKTLSILQKINPSAPLNRIPSITLIKYLQESKLDFPISVEFSRLIRFRLLSIVNCNRLIGMKEVPFTNMEKLSGMIKSFKFPISDFISELQAEESARAALFIQNEANNLTCENTNRFSLLQRLLSDSFVRKNQSKEYSPITSTPLLYNTETVFRRTIGLVLIKNKLTLGNNPIEKAENIKIFFKFPEQICVPLEQLDSYSDREPILVVEGYIKNPDLLSLISEIGFFTLINTNCAAVCQYASGTSSKSFEDQEADQDIKMYQKQKPLLDEFELDHVYCASLGEEK